MFRKFSLLVQGEVLSILVQGDDLLSNPLPATIIVAEDDPIIPLPDFYRREYRRKLGPFADFMTDKDMVPLL